MLSTKTLDGDTLAFAQTQNLAVECVDFIETTAVPFNLENIEQQNFDAVAFTSTNAVKYFFENNRVADLIKDKQIFALEGKTSSGLLTSGIKANSESASADELADEIVDSKTCKSVLHPCGNLRLPVLESKLRQAGVAYTDLVVYQTKIVTDKKVNKQFDAILFYSPSGVEGFMAQNNFGNETVCCCIGQTTAQALKEKKNTANIVLPAEPSPKAMLTSLADYFNNN